MDGEMWLEGRRERGGTLSSLLSRVRRHLELGRKPSVRHLPIEEPADTLEQVGFDKYPSKTAHQLLLFEDIFFEVLQTQVHLYAFGGGGGQHTESRAGTPAAIEDAVRAGRAV